jgi:tRNA threonylcarbamoyladenosine biosynthesis protein TsaB
MSKSYILAVETVSKSGSFALFSEDLKPIDAVVGSIGIKLSIDIIGIISALLNKNKIEISELSAIIVSDGPGNFTGLRVGWATVKGIAAALKIPYISVSILDAILKKFENQRQKICAFVSIGGGKISYKFAGSIVILTCLEAEFIEQIKFEAATKFIGLKDNMPQGSDLKNVAYETNISELLPLLYKDGLNGKVSVTYTN